MTQYDETMTRLTTQFTIYTIKTINKITQYTHNFIFINKFSTMVENKTISKMLSKWNEHRIDIPPFGRKCIIN